MSFVSSPPQQQILVRRSEDESSTAGTSSLPTLISCQLHRAEFQQRMTVVRSLLNAAHPATGVTLSPDISKEARGLAILLLYAAYENLLTTLSRSLLESATRLRVGNKRLRNGFKIFAVHSMLQSTSDSPQTAIWRSGLDLMETLSDGRSCTVSPNLFPNDGTNFRRSQVQTFCNVFGLSDPGPVLREVWSRLDTIVIERNAIAHGGENPGDVGRRYTLADLNALVDLWDRRWMEFITWVENAASSRDFYRAPR